jgi:hypothetical protein
MPAPAEAVAELGPRFESTLAAFERRGDGRVVSVTIGPFSLARFDPVDQ